MECHETPMDTDSITCSIESEKPYKYLAFLFILPKHLKSKQKQVTTSSKSGILKKEKEKN